MQSVIKRAFPVLLIGLLLGGLPGWAVPAEQEELFSLRGAHWGMSRREVRRLERVRDPAVMPLHDDDGMQIWVRPVYGHVCNVVYAFRENSLFSGRWVFEPEYVKVDEFIDVYYDLQEKLISEYGEPTDTVEWFKFPEIENDRDLWVPALIHGGADLGSMWQLPDAQVMLHCNGVGNKARSEPWLRIEFLSPGAQALTDKTVSPIALPANAAEPPLLEHRGFHWGMDYDAVSTVALAQPGAIKTVDGPDGQGYEAEVYGLPSWQMFLFHEGLLAGIQYQFQPSHLHNQAYIEDFEAVKAALTAELGTPTLDETEWHDDELKANPDRWGDAAAFGDVEFHTEWNRPDLADSYISLVLKGKDGAVSLTLSLLDADHSAELFKDDV